MSRAWVDGNRSEAGIAPSIAPGRQHRAAPTTTPENVRRSAASSSSSCVHILWLPEMCDLSWPRHSQRHAMLHAL